MAWVHLVHSAIGTPDQAIFQSWVIRYSITCASNAQCTAKNHYMCGPSDPAYCGTSSVPINLPESASRVFSHTRLIGDALAVLTAH
jgi:hypothetical protein